MTVTKRFIALVAAGAALLAAAMALGGFLWLFIAINVACFALLALDFLLSPSAKCLAVTRADDDTLYYRSENTICLTARNITNRPLTVTLKDDLPDWHFTLTAADMTRTIPPHGQCVFEYRVLPSKRGSFPFKNIHARVRGPLGLCERFHVYAAPMEMKVYPNLKDLSKYRLIIRKDRLLEMGQRHVRHPGAGMEFESLREYVEGDDYRKINWNNTARENKLIVNQFEAEKNQPVFLLIDTGRPMSYSCRGYNKLDYAINAALILADIVNQKGDNSGLMVFDTDVRSLIMPGKGEGHRNALMDALYHVEDTKNTSDYEGAFVELINRQKRRCLAFIFTDFDTLEEARFLTESVGLIKKRHIPVVVLMKNEGVSDMAQAPVSTVGGVYEQGVALEFLRERERIMRALTARGVFCVESRAEDFALAAVNRYLSLKGL